MTDKQEKRKLRFTDDERARIAAAKQQAKDFDVEFAVRMAAQSLIKLDNRERVAAIYTFIDKIDDVLLDASARAGVEGVLQHHGVDIDTNIDLITSMMEAHSVLKSLLMLIEKAAIEGNQDDPDLLKLNEEQRVGILTPDYKTLGKTIEDIRMTMVRAYGEVRRREAQNKS